MQAAKVGVPHVIYRAGKPSPSNLTPRPGEETLSFRDALSNPWPQDLGYLEAGIHEVEATGYDPLISEEPELARTLAASVTQRIAFGERAGQNVRRTGSGFGYAGERPEPSQVALPEAVAPGHP